MLKVLEQTIRDYVSLSDSKVQSQKEAWESARDFIFDDNYHIKWGSLEMTSEEFLDILDLDIEWIRNQTEKKFNARKINE